MTKRERVAHRRDAILRLAAQHGASDVRLIGSVARGEENEASDVDFIVRMESGRSLLDMEGLLMDLRELLGCDVDVVSEHAGRRAHFRVEVLRDAVSA